MSLVLKLLNAVLGNPLKKITAALDGYKTYMAGIIIILPALACILDYIISQPLSVDRLMGLLESDCLKRIGEGLAIVGFRSAMKNKAIGS